MMKKQFGKILFFGIKDEMMITISERFKFRPVKSRMSAFVDRFSMTKARRGSENQALDLH